MRATDAEIAGFFDAHVRSEMQRSVIPGASLVVVREGRVIFSRGYGFADLASRRPVTVDQTLIRQVSLGKALIWILAMQLVESGRLDLDRDINAYIDFRLPKRGGVPVTMRRLMTHSSGLDDTLGMSPGGAETLRDELAGRVPRLVYDPGDKIAYSNYGPALAAHVVERLHGRPYETLVAERIFKPLGMSHSSLADPLPGSLGPMLAKGYSAGAREPVSLPAMAPAVRAIGGLSSSSADMGRLLAMLLSTDPAGHRLVRSDSLDQMLTLQKPLGPGLHSGMGLGFIVGDYRGVRHAWHGGTYQGGAIDLQMLPDHGLGWHIAFTGRGENGAAVEARGRLLQAVVDRFLSTPNPPLQPRGPSAAEAAAGRYVSTRRPHSGPGQAVGALSMLQVAAGDDGSLIITNEGAESRWISDGPNRFRNAASGMPLVVTRGPRGQVTRLASPALNPVAEYERPSFSVRWAGPLLVVCLPVVLIAGVARLRRRRRHPEEEEAVKGWSFARAANSLAGVGPWLILAAVVAWPIALLSGLAARPEIRLVLYLLSTAAVLATPAVLWTVVSDWRQPAQPLSRRLLGAAFGGAAATVAWLLVAFGFTGV